MSTDYISTEFLDLGVFIETAKADGWTCRPIRPGGGYQLEKDNNIGWASKAGRRICIERYGGNDLTELLDLDSFVSEHEDDYWDCLENAG